MKNQNLIVGLLAALAAAYFFLNGRQRQPANPKQTSGTARAPVNSFDQLFGSHIQQPLLAGGSGGSTLGSTLGGVASLTGTVINGIRNLISSSSGRNTNVEQTPYFSTQADYKRAQEAAYADELAKYGTSNDYNDAVSQRYSSDDSTASDGGGDLEAAFDDTTSSESVSSD